MDRLPFHEDFPRVVLHAPVRILIRVDLPAPFSPTSVWISPACSDRDTSERLRHVEALGEVAHLQHRRAAGSGRHEAGLTTTTIGPTPAGRLRYTRGQQLTSHVFWSGVRVGVADQLGKRVPPYDAGVEERPDTVRSPSAFQPRPWPSTSPPAKDTRQRHRRSPVWRTGTSRCAQPRGSRAAVTETPFA